MLVAKWLFFDQCFLATVTIIFEHQCGLGDRRKWPLWRGKGRYGKVGCVKGCNVTIIFYEVYVYCANFMLAVFH